jgi:GxxExxY protein
MDGELLHREITDLILKAFFLVYNTLGYGHLEVVYKRAMIVALREQGLRVDVERLYSIHFHGVNVGKYRADLVVESKVIVEVKTVQKIEEPHTAQCFNYLKASKLNVGLVVNFGPTPSFARNYLADP